MPLSVREGFLSTLSEIFPSLNLERPMCYPLASDIILSLINLLYDDDNKIESMTLNTLSVVLIVLGPEISRIYAEEIQKVCSVYYNLIKWN